MNPKTGTSGLPFHTEVVRSWRSFRKLFRGARRAWVVSYCDTPRLVAELFDDFGLESLELVAGNASDYRERLTDEDVGLVLRLERLRREGRLRIWVCPRKTAHAKLYVLERADGSYLLASGSANMTKNSWARQVNHMVWLEARRSSPAFQSFWDDYTSVRDGYGEPFLVGLTEQLEGADTESEKEAVVRQWVAGRDPGRDPIEEPAARLADQVAREGLATGTRSEGGGELVVTLSLHGTSGSFQSGLKKDVRLHGGTAGPTSVSMGAAAAGRFLVRKFGIPGMWVRDGELVFLPPGGQARVLSAPLPEDSELIGGALAHLEAYLGTVGRHGQTREPEAA
jgi:hypothetical protein